MGLVIKPESLELQIADIFRRLNLVENQSSQTYQEVFITSGEESLNMDADVKTTSSASYVDVPGLLLDINFNNWTNKDWYFEAVFRASAGTTSIRLFNTTDAAAVASSEITTSSTSYVVVRSSKLTKPTGTKQIKVQFKNSGGTASLTIARSVFVKPQT